MNTTALYNSNKQPALNMTAISGELGKREIRATILLAAVAIHGPLLLVLSSRQRRSGNRVGRFLLWSLSAAYSPLMTSVLSYLTTYILSAGGKATALLVLVILVQFLRAKSDMAALAVAAVASPAAVGYGVNSLKIRPSTESFINTFWVAALVIYNIFTTILKQLRSTTTKHEQHNGHLLLVVTVLMSPLWTLGACRAVVRFVAFQRATASFKLGRNVQLIDGYMLEIQEELEGLRWLVESETAAAAQQQLPAAVPRLMVTGERNQDVEETPLGYQVKPSSLQGGSGSRLVTLDRVWSSDFLQQEDKDLCLSFALFKCLRRRFAGYRLAAEAGTSWAFSFVCDGLLLGVGRGENKDERVFRVIATELSFASDFFHSALPVASLSTMAAALHFLLSLSIFPSFLLLALGLLVYPVVVGSSSYSYYRNPLVLLEFVLTLVNAYMEIREMVASVSSNWTKISIIGHIVRSGHDRTRGFLALLLRRRKTPGFWHDKIGQTQMLKPDLLVVQVQVQQPCALRAIRPRQLLLSLVRGRRRNHDDKKIKVPLEVKQAILKSLRGSGGQLSDGTAAIRRHAFFERGVDVVTTTTTDSILVWHIATTLFYMKFRSDSSAGATSSASPSTTTTPGTNDDSKSKTVVVACYLSRYCVYLVAKAPDLLPEEPAWITRRYEAVKKHIEEAPKCSSDDESSSLYQHLVDTFSGEHCHEVLLKGARLGKQLVEETEMRQRQRSQGGGEARAGAQAENEVWALLSDFWSEMLLYLAPSDNVKAHIEALQRGGELITLLWALLLHAGITSRPPAEYKFTA